MKDDRQKDREDGDWNQEFRKQRMTKNANSDDDGRREQNNRWLKSLVSRASFRKCNRAIHAVQERTQTHDEVRPTKRERATEQQHRRRRQTTK